jgi:prepilin-type N-terminal cleavage/methylation domain-containing protein
MPYLINKLNNISISKNGYTVIELIVVIVIVSILAAIAIPRYFNNRISAYRTVNLSTVAALNDAVQDVLAQFSFANSQNSLVISPPFGSLTVTLINLDNNPSIPFNTYIGLYNGLIVGAGRYANFTPISAATYTKLHSTKDTDSNTGYTDIFRAVSAIACPNLFNALLRNSSVQASSLGVTASGNITGIYSYYHPGPSKLTATTSLTLTGGGLIPIVSGSLIVGPSSDQTVANTTICPGGASAPCANGSDIRTMGCIFQLTASANSSPVFYILYNPYSNMFYSIEQK